MCFDDPAMIRPKKDRDSKTRPVRTGTCCDKVPCDGTVEGSVLSFAECDYSGQMQWPRGERDFPSHWASPMLTTSFGDGDGAPEDIIFIMSYDCV